MNVYEFQKAKLSSAEGACSHTFSYSETPLEDTKNYLRLRKLDRPGFFISPDEDVDCGYLVYRMLFSGFFEVNKKGKAKQFAKSVHDFVDSLLKIRSKT